MELKPTGVVSPYESITFCNPLSLRVDGGVGAMSLSPSGRDAVLAGRRGLFVIDLDDPFAAPRWLHHMTSWEVADVQWSPHKSKPSWVVSTSNQKAMVWNLARSSLDAIEHTLHFHTRAITDINFHPNHPELLATCSVDTFVLSWDLRSPKTPVNQWADFQAAASQVKWNYQNPNVLASSHDNMVSVWDVRKGAIPLQKMVAHEGRINGLDWSRDKESEIITCSNDMTVKFWDYWKSSTEPQFTINTDFPVARARHVPFGDHTCGIMPVRGGNNSIYIVKYKDEEGSSKLKPSYIFKGHTEPVKDFLWRSRHHPDTKVDDREFQLVTWSKDDDLRLWPINEDIYENFGYEKNQPITDSVKRQLIDYNYKSYRSEPVIATKENKNGLIIRSVNSKGNGASNSKFVSGTNRAGLASSNDQFNYLNWIAGVRIGQSAFQTSEDPNSASFGNENSQPANLGEEVSTVGHKFPKLRFERISVSTGNLMFSLNGPWADLGPESGNADDSKDALIFIRVEIDFPKSYPSKKGVPQFKVEETRDLTEEKRTEIMNNLKEIAEKYCSLNRFCLEVCLRFLLGEKINLDLSNFDDDDDLTLDPFSIPYDDGFASDVSLDDTTSDTSTNIDDDDDEEDDEDEDEDEVGGDLSVMSDNNNGTLEANDKKAGLAKKKPVFDSTPVPKGCGAIWTPSGHLVCFFISKEDTQKTSGIKFGNQGFSLVNRLKRKKIENGLDLALDSHKRDTHPDDYYGDSDDSLTSDDSFSNDLDVLQYEKPYRSRVPGLMRANIVNRQLSASKSGTYGKALSNPTNGSQTTHKSKSTRNVVRIIDYRDLIPSKMELAYEYRVLGDSPEELARHNAMVAEKYGYKNLADCWKILEVILVKDVNLEDAFGNFNLDKDGGNHNNTANLMLQSDLINRFVTNTQDIDLAKNFRFYWGNHPFGSRWLAKEIINYYERIGDIQMISMLSCIMHEHVINKSTPEIPINTPYILPPSSKNSGINKHHNHHHLLPHPSVSFDRNRSVISFTDEDPLKATPSLFRKQQRMESVSTMSSYEGTQSFKSGSPDRYSYFNNKRGILPSFSLASDNMSSNRNSYMNHNQMGRGSNTFSSSRVQSPLAEKPDFIHYSNNAPVLKIQMMNEDKLDLYDDVYSTELLDVDMKKKLALIRAEYASLLFFWGLPVNRIKVLKFNYNQEMNDSSKVSDYEEHRGEVGWIDSELTDDGTNTAISPGPTGSKLKTRFWNEKLKKQCSFCGLSVNKRVVVCKKCSHVLHASCAMDWWEHEEQTECPSGCGCTCLEEDQ